MLKSLPACWPRSDFKAVVEAIVEARRAGRAIIWGLGAHVLKTGLSPVLVDLMERGFVSAVATNGAGIIHDFEIALAGATSEDVDAALGPGTFGMAEETATQLNRAISDGVAAGLGLGQSVGQFLDASAGRRSRRSASRPTAWRLGNPADGARRHRHRHHSHAPAGVGRRDRRRQPARLPLLRVVGRRVSRAACT